MSDQSWDPTGDAREALRRIVADYGAPALSSPQIMENGLDDQLPNAPERQKTILVAASRAGVASSLQEHVSQGMDPDSAVRLTASRLGEKVPFEPGACSWVTSEFARALGYEVTEAAMEVTAPPAPPSPGAPAPAATPGAPLQAPPQQAPQQAAPVQGSPPAGVAPPTAAPYAAARPGEALPPQASPPSPQFPGQAPPGQMPPGYLAGPPAGAPAPGGGGGGGFPGGTGGIVATIVVVVAAIYFIAAAAGHFAPFSKSVTHPTTSTTTPSTSPLDLESNLPAYVQESNDNCTHLGSSSFTTTNASEEVLCDLTGNTSAPEDYVLFSQFQSQSEEQSYYQSILSGNGLQTDQGDCTTLSVVTAANDVGQYCEEGYSGTLAKGEFFIFDGDPGFAFGNENDVTSICGTNPTAAAVVGWTDDKNFVVGFAFACADSNNQAKDINQDFNSGLLDVGSTQT